MARAFILALALAAAPAQAAVYGPPEPKVEAQRSALDREYFEIGPQESLDEAEARIQRDTRSAWRAFWIGQGLTAADLTLTCIALAQRNPDGSKRFREGNPIYGKNASCGRVIAIRGGISALQYLIARRAVNRDPTRAKKALQITMVIQGVPVIWNAIQLAK